MNRNKYFRQKILPFKYLDNPGNCCQPFANLQIQAKEPKKTRIILNKSSSQQQLLLPSYQKKQNSQILQLPKIAKQIDNEFFSEVLNTSASTQKPKLSRISSQFLQPLNNNKITKSYSKQPSFDINYNNSSQQKNLRYNRTIIKIKEMKQINENELVLLTERGMRSKSQVTKSSLLERRGISSELQKSYFQLKLLKSNFLLKKEKGKRSGSEGVKSNQKLQKYFNPMPTKLQ